MQPAGHPAVKTIGEFGPVLDAVVKSGDRTRRVTYFYMLLVIFQVCALRNFYFPDWSNTRLRSELAVYQCYTEGKLADTSGGRFTNCHDRLMAETIALVNEDGSGLVAKTDFKVELLREEIKELQRRALAQNALQIPFFGFALDVNDVWLICVALVLVALVVLREYLNRERLNIRRAGELCPNNVCRDLIVMSQIFPVEGGTSKSKKSMFAVMFYASAILAIAVAVFDIIPLNFFTDDVALTDMPVVWSIQQVGWWETGIEYAAEDVCAIVLLFFAYKCGKARAAIDHLVADIANTEYDHASLKG